MENLNAVWITSYPKSGNTWIHSVVRLAGKKYGFPQVDMDVYNLLKDNKLPELCPAVKNSICEDACVVLKTHAAYEANNQIHQFNNIHLSNKAYIHIYRNPLDVLLSYLNFTRLEYKAHIDNAGYKKRLFREMLGYDDIYEYDSWIEMSLDSIPQSNLDHALDYFSDNNLALSTLSAMSGSWLENTRTWINAKSDMPGISIRYEDCLEGVGEFYKLCDFFLFDKRDVEESLHFVNNRARAMSTEGNKDQGIFYNKMSAYYFRDYFSSAAIDRFLSRNEKPLNEVGYSNLFDLV